MLRKQIKISDLPEGYFKGLLEKLVKEPDFATVWVIAKDGYDQDWAAYIGFPLLEQLKSQFQSSPGYQYSCERVHFSQDVADRGDKLSEVEARAIFPDMPLRYRG